MNRWIEVGKAAKPCKCVKDSVKIDLDCFCENLKENKNCKFEIFILVQIVEEIKKKPRKKRVRRVKIEEIKTSPNSRKSPRKNPNQKLNLKEHYAKMRGIGADCKYVIRKKTTRKLKK